MNVKASAKGHGQTLRILRGTGDFVSDLTA